MKYFNAILFLILISTAAVTAQHKNVQSVSVTFRLKNAGIGVDGSFRKVNAQVSVDEANPVASSFVGTAEVNSISTGINLRDTHLKEKSSFFDAAKFPVLTMRSVKVGIKSAGVYTVSWDLTMKGITRRFNSDVYAKVQGNLLLLSTEFKIDRNEWNIGGSSMTMGDMVTVKLNSSVSK